jgi:hypothetical protein
MAVPKSALIRLFIVLYGVIATAGIYIAFLGHRSMPEPLPLIDITVSKTEQYEQAKLILEQARIQQPDPTIFNEFYRGLWWLENDYEDLIDFRVPKFEGDSYQKRLNSFNRSAATVSNIYKDAVFAISFLSSGSLLLIIIMLLNPCYLNSVLLACYPVVTVFSCVVLNINYDPLEYYWVPFIATGGVIFFLQLISSFKFGNCPEHQTDAGIPGLTIYRRGLFFINFGVLILLGVLLMASGSLSNSSHSMRTSLGLLIFGEEGVAFIGFIVGVSMVILGLINIKNSSISTKRKSSTVYD